MLFTHKIFKWVVFIVVGSFLLLIIVRFFHYHKIQKINDQVFKIQSTKLSENDISSDNLPPDPGVLADKSIKGIDKNNNGIRDDVEIAIFKKYPNSAKTRAVLLQYALVLQSEITSSGSNKEVLASIAERESQSYDCIGDIVPISKNDLDQIEVYRNFVETKQLNTPERKNLKIKFDNSVGSFELKSGCDVDLTSLLN